MTKDIGTSRKSFKGCIKKNLTSEPEKVVSVNEFKDASFSLKVNKSAGYDDIGFNVVKKCFGVLHKPMLHIFNLPLQSGIFQDKLKVAKVTPLFKGGGNISLLPFFSKINEKIMYNYLDKYLTDNSILYKNQLGFEE